MADNSTRDSLTPCTRSNTRSNTARALHLFFALTTSTRPTGCKLTFARHFANTRRFADYFLRQKVTFLLLDTLFYSLTH